MSTTDRLRCPTCGLPTIPDDGHNTPDMATCNQCYEREEGERFTTPDHRQATHTPGPWTFFTECEATPDRPQTMKFLKGADGQGFAHTVGLSEPTDTANARLIAAAPELLGELKTVREWINQLLDFQPDEAADAITNNGEDVTQRIDDLIAKAEGRPS